MTAVSFDDLAGLLPEPMLLVDEEGRILEANAAAASLLGEDRHRLAGGPLAGRLADPPEKLRRYLATCARSRQLLPGALTLRPAGAARRFRVAQAGSLLRW